MPATTSVQLLPTTTNGVAVDNYNGASLAFNGDKVKGDGYYGFSDGVHTVQTRVTAFVGTLKIQGTLQKDPAATDWVDVDNIVIGDGSTALTNSYLNNFTGNFVWVRVSVEDFTAGTINSVFMAH